MRAAHGLQALGIIASALPTAQATEDTAFTITALSIRAFTHGNATLQFTVHDPNPMANASAVCSGIWQTNSTGYPSGEYEICGNSTFAWTMQSFQSIQSFVLGVEHAFLDPSVGNYPYDEETYFADANITTPAISCQSSGVFQVCEQAADSGISAQIYAVAARS